VRGHLWGAAAARRLPALGARGEPRLAATVHFAGTVGPAHCRQPPHLAATSDDDVDETRRTGDDPLGRGASEGVDDFRRGKGEGGGLALLDARVDLEAVA